MRYNPKNFKMHDFYCPNCGQKNLSVLRSRGQMRKVEHRKVMYCPHCKLTLNMIECRNDEEAYLFKERFELGYYEQEVKEDLEFMKRVMKHEN